MGLFDKLHSKLELYRLEQKYAKRKNRQTFTTGAVYVDGEYHYDNMSQPISASSTGSSTSKSKRTSMFLTGKR